MKNDFNDLADEICQVYLKWYKKVHRVSYTTSAEYAILNKEIKNLDKTKALFYLRKMTEMFKPKILCPKEKIMAAPEKLKWAIEIPEDAELDIQVLVGVRQLLSRVEDKEKLRILAYIKDELTELVKS